MDRDLLAHLPVVVAVGRRGGFAAAAHELGMSASAVSHSVRLVEERLGQPLFARTTRSVALTEAGKNLIATAAPALQDIHERMERIRAVKGRASGLLRLNAPRVCLPLGVTRVITSMSDRYPEVEVEIFSDERLTDIVSEGFDAGIRVGEMIAQDMVTVRLTKPFRSIVVASPDYIGRFGRPKTLGDLSNHNCIGYRLMRSGGLYQWEFIEDGRDVAVTVRGQAIVTESHSAIELAIAGVGLAYVFEPLVQPDIAAGRLIELLPQHAVTEDGLFVYFPRRAELAPKLRAFIDTIRQINRESATS
ncbi:LysR family transcriptional regulator [Rhizobium sp. P38BS-XIX]|uniref:LysR family transcriptional regulator n=1 Tax=Rhizobium sp. P38BS-XIX TaxID=2726740 RepID=UPI0014577B60|nr:LysR family transcriptional regulator [Rhizobium sp. P38BS-XIX]NLS00959.1 LysR family transcriptional regulator [Rhizobium sp. P38BS-XIX]